MNLTDDELNRLNNSQTVDEWNSICDEVKDKRGGRYPPDWFNKVILSGLVGAATLKFAKQSKSGC